MLYHWSEYYTLLHLVNYFSALHPLIEMFCLDVHYYLTNIDAHFLNALLRSIHCYVFTWISRASILTLKAYVNTCHQFGEFGCKVRTFHGGCYSLGVSVRPQIFLTVSKVKNKINTVLLNSITMPHQSSINHNSIIIHHSSIIKQSSAINHHSFINQS